jgi:hypothetical protein
MDRRARGVLLLAVGLGLLVGCGGQKRCHVAGQVLHGGKPVPVGEIYFTPDASKANTRSQGFARIRDGRFDTRDGGLPVQPGSYVVRILGFDGQALPEQDLPFGKQLFPPHQTVAEVPTRDTTLDFEVPAQEQQP